MIEDVSFGLKTGDTPGTVRVDGADHPKGRSSPHEPDGM
ncbi:hypothetical protein BZB76_5436 [Actinomadura pelletieri DSM 43383]|uniref:Uncharacterized protein n=1 Tax=Actinomadura pelletieri DSM 43383 TaxID=1120940 RepID=A0A495QGC3_9ACTN|nr:hypothetical protein BZB76_5436 [Actinomadura pelletieri DSM 43383]